MFPFLPRQRQGSFEGNATGASLGISAFSIPPSTIPPALHLIGRSARLLPCGASTFAFAFRPAILRPVKTSKSTAPPHTDLLEIILSQPLH